MKSRFFNILKWMLVALLLAFILYNLYILGYGIPCSVKTFTGLSCPSCGATRMSVAFMHGDIRRAFYYNQVLPFIFLILAIILIKNVIRYLSGDKFYMSKLDNFICLVLIIILLIYGVVRNLPFYPWKI